jgi:hypothetical protein
MRTHLACIGQLQLGRSMAGAFDDPFETDDLIIKSIDPWSRKQLYHLLSVE